MSKKTNVRAAAVSEEPTELPKAISLKVSVTQEEIDSAIPANSGHCMIAEAVKRSFADRFKRRPWQVGVDLQTIRFTDDEIGLRYVYLTPSVCQRALLQFDLGIKPTPFNFRLVSNGSQIVTVKRNVRRALKKRTAKQQEAFEKLHERQRSHQKKAKLIVSNPGGSHSNEHRKIGGRTPPTAALAGNRRQFGIRAMGSLEGPTQEPKETEEGK